ncbi:MAG: hydrogenase small subunit, partial [Chloroflexi bacterium]|nr:hydrogenase small subunit [Chloroflexota bacterium]
VSLLNAVNPTIDQVLLNTVSVKYHNNLMTAAGDLAVSAARSTQAAGNYILVIEGAIPTASNGKYCYVWDENGRSVTMAEAVTSLAAKAKHIVAVGACSSFGGIPAANTAAGAKSVSAFLNRPVINLPGCPSHPDWIIGTLVMAITGTSIALDDKQRPTKFYTKQSIHDRCPRKGTDPAKVFGQAADGYCLKNLGCKGPQTHADCDIRKWNNSTSYCIAVNGPCWGCTEPFFPKFPLHKQA